MIQIRVETVIAAPPETCFDLARDLNAHTASTKQTKERIVQAPPSGLMELGDEVTFEATHFGIRQRLTSRIVEYDRPNTFTDRMLKGAFKSLEHRHLFEPQESGTLMIDLLQIETPLGALGRLAEWLFLQRYMTGFILRRGLELKHMAEDRTPNP